MDNRNPDFPMQLDIFCGAHWLSARMIPLNLTIPEQVQLRQALVIVCHSYYRAYLRVEQSLFLHFHDFQNICRLIDSLLPAHPELSEILGREYIFFLYSILVGIYGHAELPAIGRAWLDLQMNHLRLVPSPALPFNHPSFQVLPF